MKSEPIRRSAPPQADEVDDENLHHFRALAEAMPQIVWTANPDGGLEFTNRRWHAYSGLSADASRDWGWASGVHADDIARASQVWLNCVKTGDTYEVEFRLRRSDGNYCGNKDR